MSRFSIQLLETSSIFISIHIRFMQLQYISKTKQRPFYFCGSHLISDHLFSSFGLPSMRSSTEGREVQVMEGEKMCSKMTEVCISTVVVTIWSHGSCYAHAECPTSKLLLQHTYQGDFDKFNGIDSLVPLPMVQQFISTPH